MARTVKWEERSWERMCAPRKPFAPVRRTVLGIVNCGGSSYLRL